MLCLMMITCLPHTTYNIFLYIPTYRICSTENLIHGICYNKFNFGTSFVNLKPREGDDLCRISGYKKTMHYEYEICLHIYKGNVNCGFCKRVYLYKAANEKIYIFLLYSRNITNGQFSAENHIW